MDDEVPNYPEGYCDLCEVDGHTFRTCPARDDYDEEEPPTAPSAPLVVLVLT